jgi:hypothetical protein
MLPQRVRPDASPTQKADAGTCHQVMSARIARSIAMPIDNQGWKNSAIRASEPTAPTAAAVRQSLDVRDQRDACQRERQRRCDGQGSRERLRHTGCERQRVRDPARLRDERIRRVPLRRRHQVQQVDEPVRDQEEPDEDPRHDRAAVGDRRVHAYHTMNAVVPISTTLKNR